MSIKIQPPGVSLTEPILSNRSWSEMGSLAVDQNTEPVDIKATVPRLGFRPRDLLELQVSMPQAFRWLRVSLERHVTLVHQGIVYTDVSILGRADIADPIAGSHRLVVRIPESVIPSSSAGTTINPAGQREEQGLSYCLRIQVESKEAESWWAWMAGVKRSLAFAVPLVIGRPLHPRSPSPMTGREEVLPQYSLKDINAPPPYCPPTPPPTIGISVV